MPLYHPGTNILVTQSFEDRLKIAEFDDALVDQIAWKNPRYDGSKLKAKKINEYNDFEQGIHQPIPGLQVGGFPVGLSGSFVKYEGDSYHPGGLSPIISNKTTAVYIANTVIGGTEDPQFTLLRDHSYIGIDRILLIDQDDDSVQILNKSVEGFDEFHRFVTNDLPTGGNFGIKLLDGTVQSNLKLNYKIKMNKGYLLNTFDFKFASSSADKHLARNNTMYLYRSGSTTVRENHTGSASGNASVLNDGKLKFRYAKNEVFAPFLFPTASVSNKFVIEKTGPSFASSSIIENKFTKQYYSGSFGLILDNPNGTTDSQILKNSGYGSASKFINYNTLTFLKQNTENQNLSNQNKTELHITFFEGTKDFAKGFNDERSIGTFEVDSNLPSQTHNDSKDKGDECNGFLPHVPEISFKGIDDSRFEPTFETYNEDIHQAYLESTASSGINGCQSLGNSGFSTNGSIVGMSNDLIDEAEVYFQGGDLGPLGKSGDLSAQFGPGTLIPSGAMNVDNFYSGSMRYQLSFLDKDHTIITNLNKDTELFDGIGNKEIILIPDNLTQNIKSNLEFYLNKAGLITSAPITKSPINTSNPGPQAPSNPNQAS